MQNQNVKTLKLLWFGFTGAVLVYIFVAFQTAQQKRIQSPTSQPTNSNMLWILLALAVMSLVLAHVVFPKILGSSQTENNQTPASNPMDRQPAAINPLTIIQFAFSEAIALFGLVYFFMAGDMKIFLGFCAIALFSLVALYPKDEPLQ